MDTLLCLIHCREFSLALGRFLCLAFGCFGAKLMVLYCRVCYEQSIPKDYQLYSMG